MRFGVRFDTKQQTGGSGEEPPVSSILESNSAKLRAKNSVLQSKMNNLCQISRQIFRRSFSRNSARYKTFMFLCQAPRLCQIDRLPCVCGSGARTWIFIRSRRRRATFNLKSGCLQRLSGSWQLYRVWVCRCGALWSWDQFRHAHPAREDAKRRAGI